MAAPFVRTCGVSLAFLYLLSVGWQSDPAALGVQDGTQHTLVLTVLDDDGAPITDLTTEQFVVIEDGAVRTVTASRVATEPIAVALLFDTTQPPFGETLNIQDMRSAASAFVTTMHAAQPDASIQLMEFAGATTVRVKFTTDTEELDKSARRLFQSQQGGGPLMEALVDASKDIAKQTTPRRAIITVDRSAPDPSRIPPDDVSRAIQDSGASVWAISIRAAGRGTPGREEMLGMLTEYTGGTYQTARILSPLKDMLTRMAQALTHQYVITYTRPPGGTATEVLAGTTGAGKVLKTRLIAQ